MRGLAKALAALSCGAASLLTGCIDGDLIGISDRYREDFHYSYPLTAGGTSGTSSMVIGPACASTGGVAVMPCSP